MKASELYTKTIEDYKHKISVSPITLLDYCKERHINYRGIQLWISRNSITVAPLKKSTTMYSNSTPEFLDKRINDYKLRKLFIGYRGDAYPKK